MFVRADREVSYGEIMELMNLLRTAGYLKIGLVGMEAGEEPSSPQAEPKAEPAPILHESAPVEAKPAEPKP